MSEKDALLTAIRDNPEDDTPRLAYADWLDEQGGAANEAHAEYIRLEIQHARDFPKLGWFKAKEIAQKPAQQLFRRYADEWFPALYGPRNLLRGLRATVHLYRGFPYYLYPYNPSRLNEVAEELLRVVPITDLVLNDVDDHFLASLLAQPWLSRLRYIQLAGYDSPRTDWTPVADCPYLKHLHELVFVDGTISPEAAARIAKANPCPNLKRLSLSFKVTDAALARLFGGKAFAGLEGLEFLTDKIGPDGLKAVAARLKSLKSLVASYRKIPGMTKILTRAAFWPRLEELEADRCGLGNAGLAELLAKRSRLRVLRLSGNRITADGARVLADSPVLAGLTELKLSDNAIGDKGVAALVGSPKARKLRTLDVSECKIGAAGAVAIAESAHLANLRHIWVSYNDIGLTGARALAASPHLGGLTRLQMDSRVTATARKALKARFGDHVEF
jgi:uncharacterized protein (TIGR02996 family)